MCAPVLPYIIPTLLGIGTALLMKPSKPKQPKIGPIEKPMNRVEAEQTEKKVETEQTKIKEAQQPTTLGTDVNPGKASDLKISSVSTGLQGPEGRPSGVGIS